MTTSRRAPAIAVAAGLALLAAVAGCTGSGNTSSPTSHAASTSTRPTVGATATSTHAPSPKPAPAGAAMTAAESRVLLAGLKKDGWRCFASISTPFEVDRCFGTVADPPDRTNPGAAQIALTHTLPRAQGGGPLAMVTFDVLGPPAVEARGRRAVLLIGNSLFEGQGTLLSRTLTNITTFSGAVVKHPDPSELFISDDKQHLPDTYRPVPFANTSEVEHAVAAALPALACKYSTDFNCQGRADASTPIELLLEAKREGHVAPAWYVSADPVHKAATAGKGATAFRPYVDAAIDAMSRSGITTPTQAAYLRAHHHDRLIEADLGGHHLALDYDAFGGIVITDERIDFG